MFSKILFIKLLKVIVVFSSVSCLIRKSEEKNKNKNKKKRKYEEKNQEKYKIC